MNPEVTYPHCECGHPLACHGDRAVAVCCPSGETRPEAVWLPKKCWCQEYRPVVT